jgi:hypothetical protein
MNSRTIRRVAVTLFVIENEDDGAGRRSHFLSFARTVSMSAQEGLRVCMAFFRCTDCGGRVRKARGQKLEDVPTVHAATGPPNTNTRTTMRRHSLRNAVGPAVAVSHGVSTATRSSLSTGIALSNSGGVRCHSRNMQAQVRWPRRGHADFKPGQPQRQIWLKPSTSISH